MLPVERNNIWGTQEKQEEKEEQEEQEEQEKQEEEEEGVESPTLSIPKVKPNLSINQ